MILNVLQGPAQGLSQTDWIRPKATAETGTITRGTLLVDVDGAWLIAQAANKGSATAPGARIFVALNNDTDADVQFSDRIAALAADNGLIFETSAFASGLTLGLDEWLTLANGGVYTNAVVTGDTVYGQVKSLPEKRMQNNRLPSDDIFVDVVQVLSMYIPQIALAEET